MGLLVSIVVGALFVMMGGGGGNGSPSFDSVMGVDDDGLGNGGNGSGGNCLRGFEGCDGWESN